MKQTFLLLILSFPVFVFAQDSLSTSQFRFTITDASGKDLTDANAFVRLADIALTDTTEELPDFVVTKLDYSKRDSCWILRQEDPIGYRYTIEVNRITDTTSPRLTELRKMVIIYQGFNMDDRSGCQYCICNDIPYHAGEYMIDMPQKPESWNYIRKVDQHVKSIPVVFYDISDIQNWIFRNKK